MSERIAVAFSLIAVLVPRAEALLRRQPLERQRPDRWIGLSQRATGWEHQLDERWTLFLNGQREPLTWHALEVPPFHCAVEYNGWPAGLFHPRGGAIAAGSAANERALLSALERAITRAQEAAR